MMENFKIRSVSDEELHSLKKELKKDWKKTCLIQSSIHLRLCKGELEKTKLKLYRGENPKFRSFIFMSPLYSECSKSVSSMTVIWDTDEINDEEVGHLLSNIPTWDWNKPFHFASCTYAIGIRFQKILKKKLIFGNKIPMVECLKSSNRGLLMTLSVENLKKPTLRYEERYKFGSLPSSASTLMHSMWQNNFLESVDGIKERIGTYEGIGVFYNGGKYLVISEKESLVCWSHQYMHGAIGMTFTEPEHRKNGLGAAATYELSLMILKDGRIPYVVVEENNYASISCHERIGFKIVGEVGYFLYKPERKL